VESFPSGAGGCGGGRAAVGGSHLTADATRSGSLADGGIVLMIDGNVVDPRMPIPVPIGVEGVTWSLSTAANSAAAAAATESVRDYFRGFLLRLESSNDLGESLAVDDETLGGVAEVCPDVLGSATHKDSSEKSQVAGTIFLQEVSEGEIYLDVTVVVENRIVDGQRRSAYFFDSFTVETVEVPAADGADTMEPTEMGTMMDASMDYNSTSMTMAPSDEGEDE